MPSSRFDACDGGRGWACGACGPALALRVNPRHVARVARPGLTPVASVQFTMVQAAPDVAQHTNHRKEAVPDEGHRDARKRSIQVVANVTNEQEDHFDAP